MLIKYIYTFFVGLFLAIFVAMGISVFYPQPQHPEYPPESLTKQVDPNTGQPPVNDPKLLEYEKKSKVYQDELKVYNRKVSILVMVSAVVILAIALIYSEKLGVLADGLLLGGIFTLLYGLIRGFDTDSDKFRFLVATIGLGVALALGYLKFIRAEAKAKKSAKTSKKDK